MHSVRETFVRHLSFIFSSRSSNGVIAGQKSSMIIPSQRRINNSEFDRANNAACKLSRALRKKSFGGPPETRTPDPLIKSQLLYQLS